MAFEDGSSVFVKGAVDEGSAGWLRVEHRVYKEVSGDFMPRFLGWEDGEAPILLLEDLSTAHWPPPWERSMVDAVLRSLEAVHQSPPPKGLPRMEAERGMLSCWRRTAADPEPFLSLGLCSQGWLARALPTFVAAEDAAVLDGESLLHLDVRSDNICIRENRAVLVDWNWACIGNPLVDLAAWLPTLRAEGGPAPEEVMPGQPELAAMICGYFAFWAGQPPGEAGPRVRALHRKTLEAAFPWAVHALGLPLPDPAR